MNLKKFFILALSLGSTCPVSCSDDTLRCRFYFPVGSFTPDPSYRANDSRLDSFLSGVRSQQGHSVLCRVSLCSGVSPGGNSVSNRRLSDERLASLRSLIRERLSVLDLIFVCTSLGGDWEGLTLLVETSDMPYHEEALHILRDTPIWVTRGGVVVDSRKRQLMNLRGGRAWHYMAEHFFPELRSSSVVEREFEPVVMEKDMSLVAEPEEVEPADTVIARDIIERAVVVHDTIQVPVPMDNVPKPFYMGLKTNLLYDALFVPNAGVEFYLGRNWTVGANWMYSWWSRDKKHRYWRMCGGEIGLCKYFGSLAADKLLSGHHVGLYGQMFTYDFKSGDKGHMGERPGGFLWEKPNYVIGLEYGYSLALVRGLNLDFSLGLGYWGGTYYEYTPMDGHYVWEETRVRHWFGPTKAEVSLVWLLGRGNYNQKKGGRR